ncbi:solute carrier family 3 member 2a [Notolabrus celidotus]|uniref:solute carrier family 3 member 2a n=1 Tax=Notolabrus celidotus TaxID=1203425 RepID=UPI00148FB5AC|nr:solute carrier family 3 member 2a [Notolabrus celidotus]XP_034532382.1 solute carrier family 3 member 2a [Notolabrus celidotus]
MSKDTEIDLKEVELNELDPEKQPMTGDGQAAAAEKNGSVKVKVPEEEVTFTGLSKDELMKVAGTPGWVRTRWVLLVLFWLGWVGMLAGAIVIIVQAPRCKPIPAMSWWNEGPLYQIPDVDAFSDGIEGVGAKLDEINQLKVKALILGPFHTVQKDQKETLNLEVIDPLMANVDALTPVLEKAHKKGISVVLDLTPNYKGEAPWFSPSSVDDDVIDKVKAAAEHWIGLGVDGIKISDFTLASKSLEWPKLQAAIQGNRTEETKKKVLMGVVNNITAAQLSLLANTTGIDLVLSDLLSKTEGKQRIQDLDVLSSQQMSMGWGLGATQRDQLSKSTGLIRLYQLLLLTMPGVPVFTYGDEIGLNAQGGESPKMVWDIEKEPVDGAAVNETAEAERKERVSVKKWFKTLSELRGKERSLIHGDYYSLYSSESSLAFLRLWDQSIRYVTAVNWGTTPEKITFALTPTEGVELPETAEVTQSTDEKLEVGSSVSLDSITLEPGQAVLLQFPYTG